LMKEFLSILVAAAIVGLASAILTVPELLPAFLEWVAQAILYIVIAPITILAFGYVIIRLGKHI
jgi:hypothetical protein